ncbi:transposase [Streptomyces sp. NPDC005463]|uniref:transposase n=1 Tax=Streptomyces sp. NPDC005463 TaxID=3154465 RepID=UPI0033A1B6FB
MARAWPHDRAHASFSRTRWNVDNLGIVLAHLIVRTLLPQGAAITVAVDDTLFKRSGKKVFGAAWQHDGAARGPKPVGQHPAKSGKPIGWRRRAEGVVRGLGMRLGRGCQELRGTPRPDS